MHLNYVIFHLKLLLGTGERLRYITPKVKAIYVVRRTSNTTQTCEVINRHSKHFTYLSIVFLVLYTIIKRINTEKPSFISSVHS